MVHDICSEEYLMTILFTSSYPLDLITMNPHASVIYVESHTKTGGGRQMSYLRNHLRGMPLTLRENFTTEGHLTPRTEARDILLIEKQLREIRARLQAFVLVCFPVVPFDVQLTYLEQHSPKFSKFVSDKLEQIKNEYL